jgi:hypothetical protein
MWSVEGGNLEPLNGKKISMESALEDWIRKNPMVLGEDLLVIGRQVEVEEVKDKLDLLAIDGKLNTVAIEIKKGEVRGGVDIQSLKYASYISSWSFDTLAGIAEGYFRDNGIDKTFANALEEIAEEAIDYDAVNSRQRIILVGDDFDPKILSVGKWLLGQGVSIKLVKVSAYAHGDGTFLKSETVLAPTKPTTQPQGRPWLDDGKNWHLKEKCNEQAARKLQELADYLSTLEGVSVSWNQEFYVSFILAQRNWLTVRTFPNQLNIEANVETGRFKTDGIARELGMDQDRLDIQRRGRHDRITIKIGPDFNLKSESFVRFIGQTRESFLRSF